MPRIIDEGFRDFLTKLTPSDYETEAAKSHRYSIETRLKLDFETVKRFPRIGSFGNGTSISGYSDVDYLACLPTEKLSQSSNYSLQKVRNSLDARFPNTGVRVSCPAVICPFENSAAEKHEVVPADYVRDSNGYKIYDIPDCADGWMKASPDAHNDYVRSVDNKMSSKVKPLIRFIKAWKYFRDVSISSFYLELYGPEVGCLPLHVARLACQRSNCWWDAKQRRRYAVLVIAAVSAIFLAVLCLAMGNGFTIEGFVLKVAVPLSPALLLGIRQFAEQMEAAARLDTLREHSERLWNDALAGKQEAEITLRSRGLQNEILENRKRSPLVFDGIFKRLRRDCEIQMNHGVAEFVAEAQQKLKLPCS